MTTEGKAGKADARAGWARMLRREGNTGAASGTTRSLRQAGAHGVRVRDRAGFSHSFVKGSQRSGTADIRGSYGRGHLSAFRAAQTGPSRAALVAIGASRARWPTTATVHARRDDIVGTLRKRAESDAPGDVGWGLRLGPAARWAVWKDSSELGASTSFKELVPIRDPVARYGPLLSGLLGVATDNRQRIPDQ